MSKRNECLSVFWAGEAPMSGTCGMDVTQPVEIEIQIDKLAPLVYRALRAKGKTVCKGCISLRLIDHARVKIVQSNIDKGVLPGFRNKEDTTDAH
jgi:hypothetical protein